jgi:diamine N-acetyltransferase
MPSISIVRAGPELNQLLADLARQTFIESHGHSAPEKDIQVYVREKYTPQILEEELRNPENIYHLIYSNGEAAGFSKIILNVSHPEIPLPNVTKMERIYVLEAFHDQKLGWELFSFNKKLSIANHQAGMWLYVWKQNHRAVRFYRNLGFKEAGSFDFPISATHSNPNYRMYLAYA